MWSHLPMPLSGIGMASRLFAQRPKLVVGDARSFPSRKRRPGESCYGLLRVASVVPSPPRSAWLTVHGPRTLGVVASSHSRGWCLVGELTKFAAALSVLARMVFGWRADQTSHRAVCSFEHGLGRQAGRTVHRAVCCRDESVVGPGDLLAVQSSCRLQHATVERMFQAWQMLNLKQLLSLCPWTGVVATSKCLCGNTSYVHPMRIVAVPRVAGYRPACPVVCHALVVLQRNDLAAQGCRKLPGSSSMCLSALV
jgi:hypothetical protein